MQPEDQPAQPTEAVLLHQVASLSTPIFCANTVTEAINVLGIPDVFPPRARDSIQGNEKASHTIKEGIKSMFGVDSQVVVVRVPTGELPSNSLLTPEAPMIMPTVGLVQQIIEGTKLDASDVAVVVAFDGHYASRQTTVVDDHRYARGSLLRYYQQLPSDHPKQALASSVAKIGVYTAEEAPKHQVPVVIVDLFMPPGGSLHHCNMKLLHALSRAQYAAILLVHDPISTQSIPSSSAFPEPLGKLVNYGQQRGWLWANPRPSVVSYNVVIPAISYHDKEKAVKYKECLSKLYCYMENSIVPRDPNFYVEHFSRKFPQLRQDPIAQDVRQLLTRYAISPHILLDLLDVHDREVAAAEQDMQDFANKMARGLEEV